MDNATNIMVIMVNATKIPEKLSERSPINPPVIKFNAKNTKEAKEIAIKSH
ncbi:unnamed protein product, partial [marine sediment metagenome]